MAPPPKLKTLRPEDFDFNADATEWGPKLLQVLTVFCGDVTNALSRQLTRSENIRGEEWEVTFSTGLTVEVGTTPFPLYWTPKASNGRHVWVTSALDITGSGRADPVGGVSAVYESTADGKVKFRLFTGLDASRRYRIRGLME